MEHPGLLVSFEGISGCGKTYLIRALKPLLADLPCTLLTEASDRQSHTLDQDILALLSTYGDRFFRGGRPLTETFLLLAYKIFDDEARITPALTQGHLVIEDRSIDTIAIYQALILCPNSLDQQLLLAHEIYTLAARWRRLPDITFLLKEHFDVALRRAEQREGHQLAEDERAILRQADQLYTRYARDHTPRIVSLDRQALSNKALLQAFQEHILTWMTQRKGER